MEASEQAMVAGRQPKAYQLGFVDAAHKVHGAAKFHDVANFSVGATGIDGQVLGNDGDQL